MKTSTTTLFALLVITSGLSAHAQPEALERYAPDHTLYLSVTDTSDGQTLEELFPVYGEARQVWIESLSDIFEIGLLQSSMTSLWEESASGNEWDDVWGDRMMVAMTSFGDSFATIPAFVGVIETNDMDTASAFIQNVFHEAASLIEGVESDQEFFRDYVIYSLNGPGRIPGMGLAMIPHDGHIFLCTNKSLLLEILDNAEYGEDSILDNPVYQSARAEFDGTYTSFQFTNISLLMDNVNVLFRSVKEGSDMLPGGFEEMDEETKKIVAALEELSGQLSAIQYHASGRWFGEDNNQYSTGIVGLEPGVLDESFASMLNREPAALASQGYLIRDTGSYYGGNVMGLNDIWSLTTAITGLHDEMGAGLDEGLSILREMGIDVERDIFSWVGDEWAMIRPAMKLDSIMPINQTALMFSVTDTEASLQAMTGLEEIIVNLLQQGSVPVTLETEDYRGVTIRTFLPSIPLVPLSPSWFVHENNLFISSDLDLSRDMLDAKIRGRGGIDRNRYYRDLSEMMDAPSSMTMFTDIEADLYAQRDGLQRVSSFVNTLGEDVEMLAMIGMDRVSQYLLISQIYKASGQTVEFSPDAIRTEQRVLLRDLRALPSERNTLRYKVSLGLEPFVEDFAQQMLESGEVERARQYYTMLNDHNPTNLGYLSALSSIMIHDGDREGVEALFDTALQTMPDTHIVIAREVALERESSDEIISAVRAVAQTTERVNEQAALFGTALVLRDANADTQEIARQLFTQVAESPGGMSALARIEQRIMANNGEAYPVTQTRPAAQAPVIDGSADDAAWVQAEPYANGFSSNSPIELRSVHTPDGIAFLLTAKEEMIMPDTIEESVHILLDPLRQWTSFYKLNAEHNHADGQGDVNQDMWYERLDPFGLTFDPSDYIPGANVFSMIMEEFLSDVPLDDFGLGLDLGTESEEEISYTLEEVQVIYAQPGDPWAVEIFIPYSSLTEQTIDFKDRWAFNLQYVRGGEDGFTVNTSPEFHQTNPATFGILTYEDQ